MMNLLWANSILCAVILALLPPSRVFLEPWRSIVLFFVSTPEDSLVHGVFLLANYSTKYHRAIRTGLREAQSLVSFSIVTVYLIFLHNPGTQAFSQDLAYLIVLKLSFLRNLLVSHSEVPYTTIGAVFALTTALVPKSWQYFAAITVEVLIWIAVFVTKRHRVTATMDSLRILVVHVGLTAFWCMFGLVSHRLLQLDVALYPLIFHLLFNLYCVKLI